MELPAYIVNAISQNKTSLGEHPAFPPEEEEKFILALVRDYFEELSQNKEMPSIDETRKELGKTVTEVMTIEATNKEALESLVQEVVSDIFDIPEDSVIIDARLVAEIDGSTDRIIPEKTINFRFDNIRDMKNLTDEVYKRRMLNALVIGASQMYAEDITRYVQELFAINPELPSLYKRILDTNRLLTYLTKDSIADNEKTDAGRVDVYMSSGDNQPVIKSQSLFFPILVEETIKGILELAIAHGLPQERKKAEYITKKADFKLAELWDVRLGVPLWKRIAKAFEECGKDPLEIGLNFIFMHIAMLSVDDFNVFMQEVLMGTQDGIDNIKHLSEFIEQEKEEDDFEDFLNSERDKYQIDDDEFFSPEELIDESTSLVTEAMALSDIKQKWYPDIDDDVFTQIIQSDPTYNAEKPDKMGKYGKWLLNLYKTNNLKIEDLYKATEYLRTFIKYYNKIENKDINQYKSLSELYNTIKPFADNTQATSKSDEVRRVKEDAEKVYEDDQWLIVVPLTEEASCYYGKGTQWCTAADHSYNMFDEYNEEGRLYINIDKQNNRKYQFHFESKSFMDESDTAIAENPKMIGNLIGLSDGAIDFYKKLGYEMVMSNEEITNTLQRHLPAFPEEEFDSAETEEERDDILYDFASDCSEHLGDYFPDSEFRIINERYGILRFYGKDTLVTTNFDLVSHGKWFDTMCSPCCGLCAVEKNNKWNYYSYSRDTFMFNNWIEWCSTFDQTTETAFIQTNGKQNMIDRGGRPLLDDWYDEVSWSDHRRRDWLKVKKDGLLNMIKTDGSTLLKDWANKLGFFGNRTDRQTGKKLAYVAYGDGRNLKEFYVDDEGNFYPAI